MSGNDEVNYSCLIRCDDDDVGVVMMLDVDGWCWCWFESCFGYIGAQVGTSSIRLKFSIPPQGAASLRLS